MSLKTATKYYQIEIRRYGSRAVEIEAINRHGNMMTCHISRHPVEVGYWFGCNDFGGSDKLTFKGIADEFLYKLVNDVREHDRTWYAYHGFRKGSGLPLTWEDALFHANRQWQRDEEKPDFKGSLTYYTIH